MEEHCKINDLKTILWDNFDTLVNFPICKQFLGNTQKGDCLCIPLFLFSKNSLVSIIFATKYVSKIFDNCKYINSFTYVERDITYNNTHFRICYNSFKHHLEIDIENFCSDKTVLCFFLKELLCKHPINQEKHIIVLNISGCVSSTILEYMKVILEKYHNVCHFIFTSDKHYNIIERQCFTLNCNINTFKTMSLLTGRDSDFINLLCNRSNNDIINAVLLLEIDLPDRFVGFLSKQIESFLYKSILNLKSQNYSELDKNVKELTFKISAACIPTNLLCKRIINFALINKPDVIYDVVVLSSQLDNNIQHCNKEIFCFESYLYNIIKLLK